MAKTWKILSIDGGGIRGLIPAIILARLEEKSGAKISDLFDVVAGTSTGAIIALGLTLPDAQTSVSATVPPSKSTSAKATAVASADTNGIADATPSLANPGAKYSAQNLVDFYLEEGPKIFDKSLLRDGGEWIFGGARYDENVLNAILKNYFGSTRLEDALTNVLISSYCLEQRMPVFFKSWHYSVDGQYLMCDLAKASSAAPTYFKPQSLNTAGGIMGFIDGGLVTNNPALSALVECVRYADPGDKYLLFSIGTGKYERSFRYEDAVHWRPIDWLEPLLSICMDGAETQTDYELLQLTRRANITYFRFDTALPLDGDALDDASQTNMQRLIDKANKIVDSDMSAKFEQALFALQALREQEKIKMFWTELAESLKPYGVKANEPDADRESDTRPNTI